MARKRRPASFASPAEQSYLDPAQRFMRLVLSGHGCALFLIQALLGGASQHYRSETTNFFAFDLARMLPFNIARTWHVQLSLL